MGADERTYLAIDFPVLSKANLHGEWIPYTTTLVLTAWYVLHHWLESLFHRVGEKKVQQGDKRGYLQCSMMIVAFLLRARTTGSGAFSSSSGLKATSQRLLRISLSPLSIMSVASTLLLTRSRKRVDSSSVPHIAIRNSSKRFSDKSFHARSREFCSATLRFLKRFSKVRFFLDQLRIRYSGMVSVVDEC